MSYLSYEKYQELGGDMDEATFNDFAFEAGTIIDWYTFNRLHNVKAKPFSADLEERLQRLMYHLIKIAKEKADAMQLGAPASGASVDGTGLTIVSQSNDGVSVSYNVVSASEIFRNADKEMGRLVKRYLHGVMNSLGQKLLYRGLYPGE